MASVSILKARLRIERVRENRFYHKWWSYKNWYRLHSKRRLSADRVAKNRAKYWTLFTHQRTKRRDLERRIKSQIARERSQYATECSYHGINFIKNFEGYIGNVYHDSVGVATVGYGHTENVPGNGYWLPHQRSAYYLTEGEATELLHKDINNNYAPYVHGLNVKLTHNQFDALTSLVYNCGPGVLGWGIGNLLRNGNYYAAANAILQYDHAGGQVLEGLRRRREAERQLFLS